MATTADDTEPQLSAERLVLQQKALNNREKNKIVRVLTVRWWIATVLAVLMSGIFIASVVAWQYAYPPRKPVTEITVASAGPVNTARDKWLSNPLLSALFNELINVGTPLGDRYRVVTIASAPLSGPRTHSRSMSAKVSVSYLAAYYKYGPAYVFLRHEQGDTYELLKTQSSDGRFEFELPPSGPGDYLLIIGGLTNKSDRFPDDYTQLFNMRVIK